MRFKIENDGVHFEKLENVYKITYKILLELQNSLRLLLALSLNSVVHVTVLYMYINCCLMTF